MNKYHFLLVLAICAALFACSDLGDKIVDENGDDPPDTTVSFALDIQPVFADYCDVCHIMGNQGGLSLDNYGELMQGGASGTVVVAGEPGSSILVQRLEGIPSFMPPSGAISSAEIELIRRWIAQGALDN